MTAKKIVKEIRTIYYEDGTFRSAIGKSEGDESYWNWKWTWVPDKPEGSGSYTVPAQPGITVWPFEWKPNYDLNDHYSLLYCIWQTLLEIKGLLEKDGREEETTHEEVEKSSDSPS